MFSKSRLFFRAQHNISHHPQFPHFQERKKWERNSFLMISTMCFLVFHTLCHTTNLPHDLSTPKKNWMTEEIFRWQVKFTPLLSSLIELKCNSFSTNVPFWHYRPMDVVPELRGNSKLMEICGLRGDILSETWKQELDWLHHKMVVTTTVIFTNNISTFSLLLFWNPITKERSTFENKNNKKSETQRD